MIRLFALFIHFVLLSVSCNAQRLQSDDKWFNMNAIGFHHHGEPSPVSLSESDAKRYFSKERPFLSEAFQSNILDRLLVEIAGQEFKPERSVPPRDPRCFAEVSKFNRKEVHIKILKPLGGWRWHHHFQCLAIYKVQRSSTIDNIFALDKLYEKFSFTYQEVGHGMAGPDNPKKNYSIVKLLGEPDYKYPSQSPLLGRFYYEKHNLHIVTHHFVVYYVEKGKLDWVKYMKKE